MSEKHTDSNQLSGTGLLKARIQTIMAITPLWQGALFASMITVLILSTIPIEGPTPVTGWDKLNHFIAFMELAILARLGRPGRPAVRTGLAILAFGLLIELIQAPLPYRSCSTADLLADGLGILAGLATIYRIRLLTNAKR